MRAGLTTLPKLAAAGFYEDLNRKSARLAEGLRAALKDSGVAGSVNAVGSLMTIFFTGDAVKDYARAKKSDTAMYAAFFQQMLDRGVFIAPSQFEALFVSVAHTDADIEQTIAATGDSLKTINANSPA
jgi:glutamate-1-semialdehyde 2,1-aminomutase